MTALITRVIPLLFLDQFFFKGDVVHEPLTKRILIEVLIDLLQRYFGMQVQPLELVILK